MIPLTSLRCLAAVPSFSSLLNVLALAVSVPSPPICVAGSVTILTALFLRLDASPSEYTHQLLIFYSEAFETITAAHKYPIFQSSLFSPWHLCLLSSASSFFQVLSQLVCLLLYFFS